MGIINGNAIYQRMMEWVLDEFDFADPYVDDVIIGSTGNTREELIRNHEADLRKVLEKFAKEKLVVNGAKAHLFVESVEFCGHIITCGTRSPAPAKLLSIQKWEVPSTVSVLRGFLGLTNYYSSYVEDYAKLAALLTAKLQVSKEDGKKGSQKALLWTEEEVEAFEKLKAALAKALSLHHIQVDKPFVLRTDASAYAVGAVLEEEIGPGLLLQPKIN
jgi:hypothetical protein